MLPICILIILLLLPGQAHAWGGGMHLLTGMGILKNPALAAPLAGLLTAYPLDFLYGCISADITLGKKYTHYLLHCHRWGVGRKILQSARTEREQACAYGYLCHLAGDVVAHNYFVPYKILQSFATVTLKHTYWEMRFETFVQRDVWSLAREVCQADQSGNDRLLRSVVTPTLFSFAVNKRIFNSIMLLSRLERWQKVMQTLADNSGYHLPDEEREEFCRLTEEAVLSFLQDPENTKLYLADPTGEQALVMAEAYRKNLRLLYKGGRMTKADGLHQVAALREELRRGLHQPGAISDLLGA